MSVQSTRVVVLGDRRRSLELRANEVTSAAVLTRRLIENRVPRSEEWRYDPGRGISLESIASAIASAEIGLMSDLTDLGGKTIDLDPNLADCLDRRFGAVEACDYTLKPATGFGIDKAKSKAIADDVAKELRLLPNPANWGNGPPRKGAGLAPLIQALLWALWDGRAAVEKVWAPVQPTMARRVRWAIGEMQWIHPRRLSFGPRRELRLVEAYTRATNFVEVGMDLTEVPGKYLCFTPQLFREYPEREGYCPRGLYWSFFKRCSARERMVLMELYGRPWKIIELDQETRIGDPELDQLDDDVEALGAAQQLRLPKGAKLNVPWPHPDSGDIHEGIALYADRQIQKLILGQSGTSENDANRSHGEVGERQQDLLLAKDGRRIVGLLQPELVEPIVELNAQAFGLVNDDEISAYCPTIEIHTESEPDRNAEVDRLVKVVSELGAPVAVEQVYEIAGIRAPEQGEEILAALAPKTRRFPDIATATAEQDAERHRRQQQQEAMAQAMGSGGWAPPGGHPGRPMPPGAGPKPPGDPLANQSELQRGMQPTSSNGGQPHIGGRQMHAACGVLLTSQQAVPDAEHDPRELLVQRFGRSARVPFRAWVAAIESALEGKEMHEVSSALESLHLDPTPFAQLIEEASTKAIMIGVVEALNEANMDRVEPVRLADEPGLAYDYIRAPFARAIAAFRAKEPIPKSLFDTLGGKAKRQAFTVAEALSFEMLDAVKEQMSRSIVEGEDVRKFRERIRETFADNGWETPAPHRLENVFRTNVMGAYGEARFETQRQPAVIERRPYLMWVSVLDDRTRPNHAAAHGKMMRADDPAWDDVRPPAGYQCRCMLRSLTLEDAEERQGAAIRYIRDPKNDALPDAYNVVDGADPVWDDLPDDGFNSRHLVGGGLPPHVLALPPTKTDEPENAKTTKPKSSGGTDGGVAPSATTGLPSGKDEQQPGAPDAPTGSDQNAVVERADVAAPTETIEQPERGSRVDGVVTDDEIEMVVAYVVDQHFDFVTDDLERRSFKGWVKISGDEFQGVCFEACDSTDEDEEGAEGEQDGNAKPEWPETETPKEDEANVDDDDEEEPKSTSEGSTDEGRDEKPIPSASDRVRKTLAVPPQGAPTAPAAKPWRTPSPNAEPASKAPEDAPRADSPPQPPDAPQSPDGQPPVPGQTAAPQAPLPPPPTVSTTPSTALPKFVPEQGETKEAFVVRVTDAICAILKGRPKSTETESSPAPNDVSEPRRGTLQAKPRPSELPAELDQFVEQSKQLSVRLTGDEHKRDGEGQFAAVDTNDGPDDEKKTGQKAPATPIEAKTPKATLPPKTETKPADSPKSALAERRGVHESIPSRAPAEGPPRRGDHVQEWHQNKPEWAPNDTREINFDGDRPKAERLELLDDIVDERFRGARPASEGQQPVAIFTMGGAASGKTTSLHGKYAVPDEGFVVADPDEIKQRLPEYREAVFDGYTGAAAMVHEESSWANKAVVHRAYTERYNLVVDGVGDNPAKMIAKIEQAKQAGYRVEVHYIDFDADAAIPIAIERAKKTGRMVPEEVMRQQYAALPKSFSEVAKRADKAALYDRRAEGAPVKISYEGGVETIHDQDFATSFKTRSEGDAAKGKTPANDG